MIITNEVYQLLENIEQAYLGYGEPPVEGRYKRIYSTPKGLLPNLDDLVVAFDTHKSNLSRRINNNSGKLRDWFVISDPTEEQCEEAIDNINSIILTKCREEDLCPICNMVDNMLFAEGCWLLRVDHDHNSADTSKAVIHYCYSRRDYKVSYQNWIKGVRPHEKK